MSGVLCVLMGASSAFNFNATISANTTNYNLNTALTAAGWNGVDRVIATVTVDSGVYLGSTTNATSALVVGSLPAASTVAITNNGYILGKGGDGNGGAGGPALTIGYATTITNNNVIGGGGGAGGVGADFVSGGDGWGDGQAPGSGAGGGAGYLVGSGGAISSTSYSNWIGINGGSTSGTSGTTSAGGEGGTAAFGFTEYVSPNSYATAGTGGVGGGLGVAGSAGTRAVRSGEDIGNITKYNTDPGTGGAAGNCTTSGSNAYITWAVEGTRYGTLA